MLYSSPNVLIVLSYQAEARERARREEARKIEEKAANDAYICLNNLYLLIERGKKRLTIRSGNDLRILASMAYKPGDPMLEYWADEFRKLPGWNNV